LNKKKIKQLPVIETTGRLIKTPDGRIYDDSLTGNMIGNTKVVFFDTVRNSFGRSKSELMLLIKRKTLRTIRRCGKIYFYYDEIKKRFNRGLDFEYLQQQQQNNR